MLSDESVSRAVKVKRSQWIEFCDTAERIVRAFASQACSSTRTNRLFVYHVAIPILSSRAFVVTMSRANKVVVYAPKCPRSPCEVALGLAAEEVLDAQVVDMSERMSESYDESHDKFAAAHTETQEAPSLMLTRARILELSRAQVDEILIDVATGLRYDALCDGDSFAPEYSVEDSLAENGTKDFSEMVLSRFHAAGVQL